eukprot:8485578-Lingulodinium_polyedra.AAC.1
MRSTTRGGRPVHLQTPRLQLLCAGNQRRACSTAGRTARAVSVPHEWVVMRSPAARPATSKKKWSRN